MAAPAWPPHRLPLSLPGELLWLSCFYFNNFSNGVGEEAQAQAWPLLRQGAAPPAAPLAAAPSHLAQCSGPTEYESGLLGGVLGPKDPLRPCRWDNVFLDALTFQDPEEAPLEGDDLSVLDIVPHLVPPEGLFGCGL